MPPADTDYNPQTSRETDSINKNSMIAFSFLSSYQGEADYQVTGDEANPYRISLRRSVPDRALISIKDDNAFAREYTQAVGLLRRRYGRGEHDLPGLLKLEIVTGFHAWQLAEYIKIIREIKGHTRLWPEKASLARHDDSPPKAPGAGFYSFIDGWQPGPPANLAEEVCKQTLLWKAFFAAYDGCSSLEAARQAAIEQWQKESTTINPVQKGNFCVLDERIRNRRSR